MSRRHEASVCKVSPMSIRHEFSHQISQGIIPNRLYHCDADMLDCQKQQQPEASYLIEEEHVFLLSRSSFHRQLLKQASILACQLL